MTEQHPLTWETITEEIASSEDIDVYGWYHFNPDHLRAATDWQLERVIEFLRNDLDSSRLLFKYDDGDVCRPVIDVESVIDDLKKALRPTNWRTTDA